MKDHEALDMKHSMALYHWANDAPWAECRRKETRC